MAPKSPQNDEPLCTIEKQWAEIERTVKGCDGVKHLKKSRKESKENKDAIKNIKVACRKLIDCGEKILETLSELQKCTGSEETSQVKSDTATQPKAEATSGPKQRIKDDRDSVQTCGSGKAKGVPTMPHSGKSKTVIDANQRANVQSRNPVSGSGGSRLSPAPNKTKDENSSKKNEAIHKNDQSPSPENSDKPNEMDGTNAVQKTENLSDTAQIPEDKDSCDTVKDGNVPANEKIGDERDHTKRSEEELSSLTEKLEQRHVELEEYKGMIETLRHEKEQCECRMEELRTDLHKLETKHAESITENEGKMQKLRRETDGIITRLKNDNEDLSSKLGSMASDRMERDNPDVADLSDEFRATNIAEKYRQLYDKPWTDAFRAQRKDQKKDKKGISKNLLDILMDTYSYCDELAKEQEMTLKNVLQFPVQKLEEQVKQRKAIEMKPKQLETLMKLRKQTSVKRVKDVAESYLSHIRQQSPKAEERTKSLDDASKAYIQKCVEVCWPMVLNNPPLYMETAVKPGDPVNEDVFNLRTPGEYIEMLILPPLYLGKGGELLAKGTVDGQKMDME